MKQELEGYRFDLSQKDVFHIVGKDCKWLCSGHQSPHQFSHLQRVHQESKYNPHTDCAICFKKAGLTK